MYVNEEFRTRILIASQGTGTAGGGYLAPTPGVNAITVRAIVNIANAADLVLTLKSADDTAGANAVGVCQEPQNVNQPMNVMFAGISFIKLGGTVASGAEVEVGAGGTAVTKASGVSQGICLVGGASGDIGCFLIK
jgi:hypothetical protein